ncbi:ester cyclase [Bacillus cytotoxicus]|uniref:Ester cyclase n=1 Tax=Bacillus cytotoxicus TaxID=580165 RepID=A0ACC6AD01_9BACI|nr:ester cyclase [Bacillus cytotoxicus]
MRFSGTTVFKLENGKIKEELGQEEALTALQNLGLVASE